MPFIRGRALGHQACNPFCVQRKKLLFWLPTYEIGAICARSNAVLVGFNDDAEATTSAIDFNGWLHTGDLGEMGLRRLIRITGRVKDMIIRGGENYFHARSLNNW